MVSDKPVLEISNLHAGIDDTPILRGIELEIPAGEIHAIMGRNGSGKTTTANIIMGHPDFEVTDGGVQLNGENLLDMEPWERARAGVFLSFQYPQAVPGLQVGNFLRKSVAAIRGEDEAKGAEFRKKLKDAMIELDIDRSFLGRYVNDGFSGGEKKRNEILQMAVLRPTLAVMDETDSGLDIDALKIVANGVNKLTEEDPEMSILLITHYQRLLNYIKPDFVHVMVDGKLVRSGGPEIALELEEDGYKNWKDAKLVSLSNEPDVPKTA